MSNNTSIGPIFIVGAPRSGTTLLAQMLSKHMDVFIYNETVFYDYLLSMGDNEDARKSSGLVIDYLISRVNFTQSKQTEDEFGCVITQDDASYIIDKIEELRDKLITCSSDNIFAQVMSIIAARKGKKIWGEKTPNHIFHLQRIINDFPDAKIVHIIRAPEAFLLSYKYMWRQSGSKRPGHAKRLYNPYVTSKLWIKSTDAFLKFADSNADSIIEARYEDLVSDTVGELTRICEYLGIKYSENMHNIQGSNTSFKGSKEKLYEWELVLCNSLTKKYKQRYHYDVIVPSKYKLVLAYCRAYLKLPIFLISALPIVFGYFKGGPIKYLRSRGILASNN